MDAGSMRDGMVELCGLCDIVLASQRFAFQLTGSDNPQLCITALHELGVDNAGVTLGSKGSLYSNRYQLIEHGAFKVDVVDTTGAGDAFHGGYIYGLMQGWEPVRCITFASAIAALKCTRLGTREGLPSINQVTDFIKHNKAELTLTQQAY
jgi:ribokinase